MNIVEILSVYKKYNKETVLHNVSLLLEKGERVVILGPSGCGKTTILRLVAGFIYPDKGKVIIEGDIVSEEGKILKPPEVRNVGMVFQDLALWPHMTVKGNIEFGLKIRGISKEKREEKIKRILEMVGMGGFEKKKPSELSGGQKQRVALARALVLEPKVLLMDEPLSSLDFELNKYLRKEILDIQNRLGFTMLYVTHDRDEAFDIATRIIYMKKGRIEDVKVP